MKMITKLILVLVSLASLAVSSMATTIFTDDFTDGNRDGWYRYAKNADSSLAVVGGTLELNSTNTNGAVTNNFAAVRPFAAVDMTVVDTKVTLQLNFLTLENHATDRGIGIGLYDSEGTAIIGDSSSGTVGENDSGYFTYIRRGAFQHRLNENNEKGILETATGLASRANDTTSLALRVNSSPTGFHVGGVTNNPSIWYTYRLEIESIDVGGNLHHVVTVTLLQGATTLSTMTYTDTATLVASLDQVGVLSMAGNDLAIDNVSVTADLPGAGTPDIVAVSHVGGNNWEIRYVGVVGATNFLQEVSSMTNIWSDVGDSFVSAAGTNVLPLTSSAPVVFWRLRE